MSFKCSDCHSKECPGYESRSHGACESCGKSGMARDCRFVSPEKQVEVDREMLRLGFTPDPLRRGKWL